MKLKINGRDIDISEKVSGDPLLWVLREELGLYGTKFGCGAGLCGACTIHVDGQAIRSCQVTAEDIGNASVTTIEGLAATSGADIHPIQRAWIEESVPQCGYCQAGQIMSAAALLTRSPNPSTAEIDDAMAGNLCRCGTYDRIRRAIARAVRTRS